MGDIHNAEGGVAVEAAVRMIHYPGNCIILVNSTDFQFAYEKVMPMITSAERRCDYGFNSGFCAIVFHCLLEMDRLDEGNKV